MKYQEISKLLHKNFSNLLTELPVFISANKARLIVDYDNVKSVNDIIISEDVSNDIQLDSMLERVEFCTKSAMDLPKELQNEFKDSVNSLTILMNELGSLLHTEAVEVKKQLSLCDRLRKANKAYNSN